MPFKYKTKILIVDDKAENILALSNLITAVDVEILSATSGDAALGLLLSHDFALAILDVQMPIINGFELARLMRTAERSRGIPIIFVTASEGNKTSIFEGYEKGAVDYLLKPLDPHMVRSKVRVFVELDQKSRALKAKLLEVESLKDAAEAASRAKSRFLANISHEIRTPLGAVLGFADLLRYSDQSPADRESCIASIERNGLHLLKLIDDILDLSKIEAERIEAECVPFRLADLIADLKAIHGVIAAEKGIRFDVNLGSGLPKMILSDPMRLKQILGNIVGNAVKFTGRGQVTMDVTMDRQPDQNTLLQFLIADSGCGLTNQEVSRLFQPFMQADSSTTRKYGGTGLGLVISKQLANLLGGDVILRETAPGKGSVFVVTIDPGPFLESPASTESVQRPEKSTFQKATPERTTQALCGLNLLVADDAADNRLLISRLLKHMGAEVDVVEDGAQAIEQAMVGNYDVILMDIQMPNVDGYEATTSLRNQGYKRPIIALTAHAMKEELDRCLNAGCDRHLSKPINRQDLIANVLELANKPISP